MWLLVRGIELGYFAVPDCSTVHGRGWYDYNILVVNAPGIDTDHIIAARISIHMQPPLGLLNNC